MNDLQLSLIAIGVAAVGTVFAYNKWQEYRHRKLAERMFQGEREDVLLKTAPAAEARVEPVIGVGGDAGAEAVGAGLPASAAAESRANPLPQEAQTRASAEPRSGGASAEPRSGGASAEPPRELLDAAVDCVVRFESAESVGGGYLWQAQREALGKLTKRCGWIGLNEGAAAWEELTAHGAADYRRLRVGLQLADRHGPVSDGELNLFFNGVQRLADEFLAVADMPGRGEMLARAADLDQFCAGVDIQIGVNVVAKGNPFPGTKLRGLAEAAGLTLQDDGVFHAQDDDGETLFTLSNLEPALFAADELKVMITHGVTFTLDVPRVARGAAAFDRMMAAARQFAASLGGALVDDNRTPLADSAVTLIRDKIVEVEGRMAARGIPAGSPHALRLFS